MSLPANIRVNTSAPFPSLVTASGPVTLAKANGIWKIGLSVAMLGVENVPNPATTYLLLYDSVVGNWFKIPLSSLPITGARVQRSITGAGNLPIASTDQILNVNAAVPGLIITIPLAVTRRRRCSAYFQFYPRQLAVHIDRDRTGHVGWSGVSGSEQRWGDAHAVHRWGQQCLGIRRDMMRLLSIALAAVLLVLGVPAYAQTTPGVLGPGQIVGNYAVGQGLPTAVNPTASGLACPTFLTPYQLFANTTGAPTAIPIQVWDGAQCVTLGTLNATTHNFATLTAGVASIGNNGVDASLTFTGTGSGPFTGAVTAKINLANPTTWTALHKHIQSGDGILVSNNGAATTLINQGIDVVEDGAPSAFAATSYGVVGTTNMPSFIGEGARGTLASPAVPQANDALVALAGRGYIGGGFSATG